MSSSTEFSYTAKYKTMLITPYFGDGIRLHSNPTLFIRCLRFINNYVEDAIVTGTLKGWMIRSLEGCSTYFIPILGNVTLFL